MFYSGVKVSYIISNIQPVTQNVVWKIQKNYEAKTYRQSDLLSPPLLFSFAEASYKPPSTTDKS
jgi:uncharacterized surface anchored protein